jgi:hypothetical protein
MMIPMMIIYNIKKNNQIPKKNKNKYKNKYKNKKNFLKNNYH